GFLAAPLLLASQPSTVVHACRVYLLVIPISLFAQCCSSILQGRMELRIFNWLRLVIPFGYLVGVLILQIATTLTLFNIVFLHLALNLMVMVMLVAALFIRKIPLGLRPDIGLARRMLRYGLKVQVGDISQQANTRLDQTLIAAFLPPAQLGIYTAA